LKSLRLSLCFVVLVAALAFPNASKAQFAHLTLQSQPGDFIGGGGNFDITYTPKDEYFSVEIWNTVGDPEMPSELLFQMGSVIGASNTYALLFFGTTQLGIPIQPGFYPNAERSPFESPGHPGLSVAFQNRGCSTVTGNFTITDVTFGANNAIETFAATFEQHCDGMAPALFGSFTYDAHGVPEPGIWSLLVSGMAVLGSVRFVTRRITKGTDGNPPASSTRSGLDLCRGDSGHLFARLHAGDGTVVCRRGSNPNNLRP
jgi:hypothetical protein